MPGRQERIDGKVPIWLDVGHNLEAVTALAGALRSESVPGKTRAVFAMLKDKDVGAAIEAMRPVIDYWYPAVLEDDRALSYEELRSVLSDSGITDPAQGGNPSDCFEAALAESQPGDRLVVLDRFTSWVIYCLWCQDG